MSKTKKGVPSYMECPLVPQDDIIITRALGFDQYTESGLRIPSGRPPTPGAGPRHGEDIVVLQVIAVGPGELEDDGTRRSLRYQAGDYVLTDVRNCELIWQWYGNDPDGAQADSFQVFRAKHIAAKVRKEAIDELKRREQKFSQPQGKIIQPPKDKILGPDDQPAG